MSATPQATAATEDLRLGTGSVAHLVEGEGLLGLGVGAVEAAEPAEELPSSDEILRGIESLLREQRDEPGEDAR